MTTINTPVVVNSSSEQDPIHIVKLTSTLAMAIYEVSARLKAVTITIGTDNVLTVNTELDIDPTSVFADQAALVALTGTSALVTYEHNGTDVRARVLSVSGTTITANAQTTLTDSSPSNLSLALINSTNVLYCYDTNSVKAVVLSVSGTTITENSIISVGFVTSLSVIRCSVYSSTRALVTYVKVSTLKTLGTILTISGTTLTANTEKAIDATPTVLTGDNSSYNINMSATKAVVGFVDLNIEIVNYVLTLSGVTFNVGTKKADTTLINGESLSAAKLDNTSLITINETDSDILKAVRYDITGAGSDELTEDSNDTLTSINVLVSMRCAPVDATRVIAHYHGDSVGGGSPSEAVTISSAAAEFNLVLGGGQP